MRVAMQVLTALAASVLMLSALIHVTGTADTIADGVLPPQSLLRANEAKQLPPDPSQSPVLQQIFTALGTNASRRDCSNGAISVSITYEGKKVDDGSYVPMLQAAKAPGIQISDKDRDAGHLYTWILIDIDAPNPQEPSHSPFLHWIVANLDPSGHQPLLQVVSYYPVSPPEGDHRYVGLLFTQDGLTTKDGIGGFEEKFGTNRGLFDVAKFVDRQGLAYTKWTYFYSRPIRTQS